ncbi:hypothetical protein LTR10_018219 [Elasticomyces elasticus]|uniref:Hydantoinase/oxoprolinase n=1 Tax=Exophiala sideris TaxID=1016849 RepID=A0ABR0JIU3_9EURO|nr:hypothetical protein LTR10_018219 [Elasticomyces elasticus]KAK5034540.1 hypothetical protein LTS07_003461 [Exophiala sideris]KAK5042836.1 hypothetical protein LTR13_001684 [Exophiala sideris]KAK5065919.1 hypothetical protein LTR69_003469 [Exophiala sideris]KAK5185621.1 hypothetical protein LTR44_001670 [Eurotiomycetes sp. CCFEE 6388]
MGSISNPFRFRIGVDVGGTNTDAVILDTNTTDLSKCVVAAHKTATTSPNVTDGIEVAVRHVLDQSEVPTDQISCLTIGTTHFINAIVEHDHRHLSKVAVIRLSKSFTREIPPFFDFPPSLKGIMYGWHTYVDGGLQIDGSQEAPIVEQQVIDACATIKGLGLTAIVVCGVFSPLDSVFNQEQRVRDILYEHHPDASVVCSSEISNLGFLERENASILNASIYQFAQRTISGFRLAMKRLDLRCALYLTQNDGTLIDAHSASQLPIRTFSSGPTNSMRGAAYLSGLYSGIHPSEASVVCDIGGTTADVGILLPSGYPRQSLANVAVAGVKINYGMPQVESIGIGGGSIVRCVGGKVTVGPDSVGYAINEKALIFDGDTLTATDIAVASGIRVSGSKAQNTSSLDAETVNKSSHVIKSKLERVIDLVKTSPKPLDLILVGGGSIISPDLLEGVNRIIRPPHFDVANAVGAAISRVSASVDIIQDTSAMTTREALRRAEELAIQKVIKNGADPATVTISEQEVLPLQYLDHRIRTIVKAVGDFVPSSNLVADFVLDREEVTNEIKLVSKPSQTTDDYEEVDINTYRPNIQKDLVTGIPEWLVSATDLEWMADGCYVLGCAGGGTSYPEMLKLRRLLQEGHTLRIIDVEDLVQDARVYWAGNMGSPSVPQERLVANESVEAIKEMMDYQRHDSFDALIGLEIGGSNGLLPLSIGSSKNFDRPVLDADWMGRAYPNLWQVTIAVHEPNQICPCAIASGDGRCLIMTKSPNDRMIDRTLRAPAVEMGYYVGLAARPTTTEFVKKWSVRNTMSQAWRIGRCIARAGRTNTVSTVTEQIIAEVGGTSTAKLLFRGKIVGVERRLHKGHSHGEVVIQEISTDVLDQTENGTFAAVARGGVLRIPFMNENLIAEHHADGGQTKVVATVPDLIVVLDSRTGTAIGVPEYKYGVVVTVLGITCSPIWQNKAGLEAGGPGAFGFDEIVYKPLGVYQEPSSVIREYLG